MYSDTVYSDTVSGYPGGQRPRVRPVPRLFSTPLRLVPARLHSRLVATALNRVLAAEIRDGELDFLLGRVLAVRIDDAGVDLRLGLRDGRLVDVPGSRPADLAIEGKVYEFLLLIARREDPDTLFFQRRLRLQGDTELGLYLKNFLDALELEDQLLPLPLRHFIRYSVPVYDRLLGR